MPTFDRTRRFDIDYGHLSAEQRTQFVSAVRKFVADLGKGAFRPSLRVKGVQGARGVFEMSWAANGRATFRYGEELLPGQPHIIWRRIGTHDVLGAP